jgi:hypothetical protein
LKKQKAESRTPSNNHTDAINYSDNWDWEIWLLVNLSEKSLRPNTLKDDFPHWVCALDRTFRRKGVRGSSERMKSLGIPAQGFKLPKERVF